MTRRPLRVAIAGRFFWHNGSSHALLGYVRASQALGIDARVSKLGLVDEIVARHVPVAEVDWQADLIVLVCEELFLTDSAKSHLDALHPRHRRILIDPDGRYSPLLRVPGDTTHESEADREVWVSEFQALSDVIVQPTLGDVVPGTHRFLYFGVDRHRARVADSGIADYDIVYVGNNWYRWNALLELVDAAKRCSPPMTFGLFGQWWDGQTVAGCERATYSDPAELHCRGVAVHGPVPFDQVESTMASGMMSPILVRPVLGALRHATPRMFETFIAGTIPLIPRHLEYMSALLGGSAPALVLGHDVAETLEGIRANESRMRSICRGIVAHLEQHHSYEVRWRELLALGGHK